MEISLEEAYREACLALGEQIVRERLTAKHAASTSPQEATDVTPQA